jgi:WD40 repeat protein
MCGTFSPDRSRLLTGGDGADPKVHIWDVETGNCLHTLAGHKEPVASLAWADNQLWVASGAFDRCVRLWDVGSGEELMSLDAYEHDEISDVIIDSTAALLIVRSNFRGDVTCKVWDIGPQQPQRKQ